jgi:Phage tail assembly chaperone
MSKVTLGKPPKTFKPFTVKFPMPDGTEGRILATFNYRTSIQFGQFLNQVFDDEGETEQPKEKRDFEGIFTKTKDQNAGHLLLALSAWDLDEPLCLESLQALADELPAAAAALMTAYRGAVVEGRLGN